MSEEQIFRFLALRQAATKIEKDQPRRNSVYYSITGEEPQLAKQVFRLPTAERTKENVKRLTQEFQSSNRYLKDIKTLPLDISPLASWLEENSSKKMKALDFANFIQKTYGKVPADLAKSKPFIDTANMLTETLFADMLSDNNRNRKRDDIVHAIKLLHLVNENAKKTKLFESDELLGEFFARMLVMIPELTTPQPVPQEPTIKPIEWVRVEEERVKSLRDKLDRLTTAHAELIRTLARPEAMQAAPIKVERPAGISSATESRINLLETQVTRLASKIEKPEEAKAVTEALAKPEVPATGAGIVEAKPIITFSNTSVNLLSQETKASLSQAKIDLQTANPFTAVTTLETQIAQVAAQLPATTAVQKMIAFGGIMLDANRFKESLGIAAGTIEPGTMPIYQPCQFKAGIGDLLIVRQKLKAYELGDFAHVENVLMGESRSREHRRLSLREEITTVETESETEKERDLQSTERNEMQNEANKTVQSQFQLDAGLQVSGSYGPAVSFSASLNTSFSTSTEESQRKAVSYSREVTEKTSERIRERVREEERRRVLEQIEEINIHKIENNQNPKGHIRGIYRWLNKIYDAQVFNYGQRMMYEFVIPEPGAYFLYALVENPPKDMEIEKPEAPTYPMGSSTPLKPENLTRYNYQSYLAKYEVTNAKAPPSSYKNVAYFEKQEGKEESHYQRASKVTIPEGYEANSAATWWNFVRADDRADRATMRVIVGNYDISSGYVYFGSPFRDEVAVGVYTIYNKAFTVTIDIHCRLTEEGFAKWQQDTYAAIMESYLNKKAIYEEKLAQIAIQKGVQILGRNPLENRRIERDELRKLVIMTLMQNSYLDINSFYGGAEPIMNITKACQNGSKIRFFENAFEWNNMTYVSYPYFWGRHARWISALQLTDPDPDFSAFLKAGAARVQVPVRPGFERAVAYFCQVGAIWEGNDVPLIGDSLYVPIVQEITENLGKLEEGVPYPEGSKPWEVTVPTSLVVVQNLEEIPQIRDILTGNPIKLQEEANP